MRCPNLSELPSPPLGRTGWPWTTETPHLPQTRLDGSAWPRISIVTPSYGQRQFIEETIRSVLLQGYPDVEYFIIDGGSTDGTVDIIKKYEHWLTHWVSEKDRGQSHAINKGFSVSSGAILAWINSDDYYAPDALGRVGQALNATEREWLTGVCQIVDADGSDGGRLSPDDVPSAEAWLQRLARGVSYIVPQPTTFWSRPCWELCAPLDIGYHYSFDHEFFFRLFSEAGRNKTIAEPLASFRVHEASKTTVADLRFKYENVAIFDKHRRNLPIALRSRSRIESTRTKAKLALYGSAAESIGLRNLFRLALRWPALALDRMYWGAVRRTISRQWPHRG